MYAILFTLLICLFSGCSPRYSDFYPYYDNGTKKPSLVLLPLTTDVQSPLANDMQDMLTRSVQNRIKRDGKMYIPPQDKMQKVLKTITLKDLADSHDPKRFLAFQGVDFVVSMELSDCQVLPYKRGAFKPIYIADIKERDAKVLVLAVRLKIVQLSGKEPKIVRQELVKSNHMVTQEQINKALKGDAQAIEMMRSRLARDLAHKIEETICIKK